MSTSTPALTLTVPEAAELLGCSVNLAYQLATKGELPGALHLGRKIVVSRAALLGALGIEPQDVSATPAAERTGAEKRWTKNAKRPRSTRGPRQSNTTNGDTVAGMGRARSRDDRRMSWLLNLPTSVEDYLDAARHGYLGEGDIPRLGRAS